MPAIAALAYHRASGRQFAQPDMNLSYSENFLYMLDAGATRNYRPNPRLARAIDIMFTLHAEHEMNCSTAVSLLPLPNSQRPRISLAHPDPSWQCLCMKYPSSLRKQTFLLPVERFITSKSALLRLHSKLPTSSYALHFQLWGVCALQHERFA